MVERWYYSYPLSLKFREISMNLMITDWIVEFRRFTIFTNSSGCPWIWSFMLELSLKNICSEKKMYLQGYLSRRQFRTFSKESNCSYGITAEGEVNGHLPLETGLATRAKTPEGWKRKGPIMTLNNVFLLYVFYYYTDKI